jgi:cobalt/nickel transport system permease protein
MGIAHWIEIGGMDELSRQDTPVHRLDARAKAAVTLTFIAVVMSFGRHELSALTPFALYPLVLLALGRIPLQPVLRKILVAAPFALAVGIFNPLLDREPLARIGPWVVTSGWMSFASIMARFALTVGAALVLVACTGMYRLGAGLERLGLPRVFTTQLLFLYRYLFVVAEEGATMRRSVELRAGGVRALPLRSYGSLVGHLLLRSLDRADRIHRAMVARGFDGEVRLLQPGRFGWREVVFVAGWLAFFAVARRWNLAELLGRVLTGWSA